MRSVGQSARPLVFSAERTARKTNPAQAPAKINLFGVFCHELNFLLSCKLKTGKVAKSREAVLLWYELIMWNVVGLAQHSLRILSTAVYMYLFT